MLESLMRGTLKPTGLYIVDNGRDPIRLRKAIEGVSPIPYVVKPEAPMGLAEAWNWFARYVPAERLICNDDLVFGADSLKRIVETQGEFVSALPGTNACSCFLLRDSCIAKVGYFDEDI